MLSFANMFLDTQLGSDVEPDLRIPDSLLSSEDHALPQLTSEVLNELREAGWSRVGLMIALVDSDGDILMLNHNARDKNSHGALGPLGETSQEAGPVIEQPFETLYRGIQEELGIQHPGELDLWMYPHAGWVINHWPRGNDYPNEFACAISFPIFVSDAAKEYLLAIPHGTEEIHGLQFIDSATISSMGEDKLRPGVKNWLRQLTDAGLLDPTCRADLERVDFSNLFVASQEDIRLD